MKAVLRIILLTAAAIALTLGLAGPVLAEIDVAGWQFNDISSHGIPLTFDLAFDSGRVAWIKYESGADDAFLLDLASGAETRVTETPENEGVVALDGARMVWAAWQPGSDVLGWAKIYLHDLDGGTTRSIGEGRIEYLAPIKIVGDHIAWVQLNLPSDGVSGQGGGYGLYVYTISSGTTVRVSERLAYGWSRSGGLTSFDLGEDDVAFVEAESPGGVGEVRLCDLGSGVTRDLGPSLDISHHVSLEGDLVTWAAPGSNVSGDSYEAADILIHKISTGVTERIATIHTPEPFPKTDGRFAVWDDYPENDVMSRRVIGAYDTQTRGLIDVSHNLFLNFTPEISDGLVVWERGGELESEIMACDLLTEQTTQLSDNRDWMDQLAVVSGRTVIWWKHFVMTGEGVEPANQMMVATAPESYADPFVDVSGSHRYRTAILGLSELGIAGGYQTAIGQEFRPESSLLRAQFAKMICEAFDVPVTEGLEAEFADLGADDPLNLYPHEYVAALTGAGIINGKTATTFDPYSPVTRAQAASMLVRALDVYAPGLLDHIEAQPPGAYYWEPPHLANLKRAYANDLMSSLVDWLQRWDARASCSRGEAAQLVWNALSLVGR